MRRSIFVLFIFIALDVFLFCLFLGGSTFKIGDIERILHKKQFSEVSVASGVLARDGDRGASFSDFDGDGKLDLLITGLSSRLYRNLGSGKFSDVTDKTGIDFTGSISSGIFGDFTGDGCPDLFLTRYDGPVSLYKNNCNGTFSDVTDIAGIKKENFRGYGAAWADYDNDGFLDLYVANHGTFNYTNLHGEFQPNYLYHNNGNGTFSDLASKAGVSGIASCGLSQVGLDASGKPTKLSYQPIWFDFNGDNLVDLFVSTDYGVSPLYKNNGNGTFSDVTASSGLCKKSNNMGVGVGDFNGDGNLDFYVTNIGANFLWKNNGNGTFSEVADITHSTDILSIGWGTGFVDFDNDGNLDIFVANGKVLEPTPENPQLGQVKLDRLYKNEGSGVYKDVASFEGIFDNYPKEAVAFGDYNNDGFVDLVVISSGLDQKGRIWLYKNNGNNNHWLTVEAKGTKSNRDSIGAVVKVKTGIKTQMRQITAGSSYISQESLWQTFGLGNAGKADEVIIVWPSGITKTLKDVKANQKIVISE